MFPIVLLHISWQNLSLHLRVTQKDLQLPVFLFFSLSTLFQDRDKSFFLWFLSCYTNNLSKKGSLSL